MFVDEFGHEVWSLVLEPGVYNVTLKKPVEVCNPGFKVINFQFTVDGLNCEIVPNYFHLDKTHIDDGLEEKTHYKIKETMIRKCFRITSPLKDEYFDECIGKKGKVSVIKTCSGKIIINDFFPNGHITKEEVDIIDSVWEKRLKLN